MLWCIEGLTNLVQAGRSNGFTAGIQFRPHGPMTQPLQYIQSKGFSKMSEDIAEHISYAVAYSPEHKSTFGKTASRKGGQVAASQGPLCA